MGLLAAIPKANKNGKACQGASCRCFEEVENMKSQFFEIFGWMPFSALARIFLHVKKKARDEKAKAKKTARRTSKTTN